MSPGITKHNGKIWSITLNTVTDRDSVLAEHGSFSDVEYCVLCMEKFVVEGEGRKNKRG